MRALALLVLVACTDPYLSAQASCVERYSTRAQIDTCRAAARLPFADASAALNPAATPRDAAGMPEARARAMASAAAILATGPRLDAGGGQ